MFNSTALEVATGLVLVFLLTSILCTAITELIAGIFRLRSTTLEEGIQQLVGGAHGEGVAADLYRHPQIAGLSGKHNPSYIPAANFARALLDVVLPRKPGELPPTLQDARALAEKTPKGPAQDYVLNLLAETGNDITKVRGQIETWFDESMNRVSGIYKRRAQLIIVIVAGIACGIGNVDSIGISNRLLQDPELRRNLVAAAQKKVDTGQKASAEGSKDVVAAQNKEDSAQKAPAESGNETMTGQKKGDASQKTSTEGVTEVQAAVKDLHALDIPLGWHGEKAGSSPWWYVQKVLGILLSALAASLGAPFWFDVLSKLVNVRMAGKKPATQASTS